MTCVQLYGKQELTYMCIDIELSAIIFRKYNLYGTVLHSTHLVASQRLL